MALLALVLGVFGAVYFQGGGPASTPEAAQNEPEPSPVQAPAAAPPTAPTPQAVAPAENRPQEQATAPRESNPPAAVAAAPPAPTPAAPQSAQAPPPALPAAPAPSEALPQTQIGNPSPSLDSEAQRLAQISPSAAPANIAAGAPRYWVEFAAYEGTFYADRLKQNLAQLGIAATVSSAPGKQGRRYLRVRTSGDSDRATATAQFAKARSALHIAPLLHHVAAISPAPARPPEAAAAPSPSGRYWVQFGAFRTPRNAAQIVSELRKRDVQALVIETKSNALRPLYLVRVSSLADRALAKMIAQRGAAALQSHDALIGERRVAIPGLHPRPPPR